MPNVTKAEYEESLKSIKSTLMTINQSLKGDWIVGNNFTVADIFLAGTYHVVFQVNLDQGFAKAAPKVCAWFKRVTALPEFIAVFGIVRMAKKRLDPVFKQPEEMPKGKKGAAANAA